MSAVHLFTLPFPPSVRDAWRPVRGRGFVPTQKFLDYKITVARLLREHLPLQGPVVCDLTVYFPRDSGDLSNRLKVLEDSLEGFAYHDDKQIRGYTRLWREVDPENPRAEMRVEGERFATPQEAVEERRKRVDAGEKRRATIRRNKALRAMGVQQPTSKPRGQRRVR